MNVKLELLVNTIIDGEEALIFTPFMLDIDSVQGFYVDPIDSSLINLVISGNSYEVKRNPYLEKYISANSDDLI